jgi:hemoglobin-like flavoprotein
MGTKHGSYGVQEQHYGTVGACLLWTLEQGLGADFTPAVRDAWIAAYDLLAGTMKRGARETELMSVG